MKSLIRVLSETKFDLMKDELIKMGPSKAKQYGISLPLFIHLAFDDEVTDYIDHYIPELLQLSPSPNGQNYWYKGKSTSFQGSVFNYYPPTGGILFNNRLYHNLNKQDLVDEKILNRFIREFYNLDANYVHTIPYNPK